MLSLPRSPAATLPEVPPRIRPAEDKDTWFNIFVLHQNRVAHTQVGGARGALAVRGPPAGWLCAACRQRGPGGTVGRGLSQHCFSCDWHGSSRASCPWYMIEKCARQGWATLQACCCPLAQPTAPTPATPLCPAER